MIRRSHIVLLGGYDLGELSVLVMDVLSSPGRGKVIPIVVMPKHRGEPV